MCLAVPFISDKSTSIPTLECMLVRNSPYTQGSTWYLHRNAFFPPIWAYWINFLLPGTSASLLAIKTEFEPALKYLLVASAFSQHFGSNVDSLMCQYRPSCFVLPARTWICRTPGKNIVLWRRPFSGWEGLGCFYSRKGNYGWRYIFYHVWPRKCQNGCL